MTTEKPKEDLAAKVLLEAAAIERANREVAPGPLKHVFTVNNHIEIKGEDGKLKFSIRPVTEFDFVILREINSFLYHQQLGDEIAEPPVEGLCEFCLLLTLPQKEVRRILRRSREDFADLALKTFFENKENFELVSEVVAACSKQFEIALSTMQQFGAKEEAKSDVTFFPDSAASQKTV